MTASIPILPANVLPPVSSSSLILQEGPWESRVDTTARKLCPQLPTLSCSRPLTKYMGAHASWRLTLGKTDPRKRPLQTMEADSAQRRQDL